MTPQLSLSVQGISKAYRMGKRARGAPRILPRRAPLAKQVREVWALRDVSFDVEPGTVLGVIGPNGAGKSTLLKVLARVSAPTAGRATARGRVVSLLELGAGFQRESTGRENVYLNAALQGIPRSIVDRRIDEIVAFAELEQFIDTPVKRYSSGMYLRLAFSVAINMEPNVLLADEVLAVGDMAFQERCLQRVEVEGRRGVTVLFVSHDMSAIQRLCHRVIWLDRGEIVADGGPDEVTTAYADAVRLGIAPAGRVTRSPQAPEANHLATVLASELLSNEGTVIGAVRAADGAQVKLTVQTHVPGVHLRGGLAVVTDEVVVFTSLQPQPVIADAASVYSLTARIPADLLADRRYRVTTGIVATKDGLDNPLICFRALEFPVYHAALESETRGITALLPEGVVRPTLDWRVTHERELEAA